MKNLTKKYGNYIIVAIIYLLAFIGIPFIFTIYNELAGLMFIMLLVIFPLLTLILSAIFSKKSFDLILAIIPAAIFFLALLVYMNYTAWVYCVGYFIIAIIGNFLGYVIKGKK